MLLHRNHVATRTAPCMWPCARKCIYNFNNAAKLPFRKRSVNMPISPHCLQCVPQTFLSWVIWWVRICEVEHLFICWRAIYISLPEKFCSFAQFSTGLLILYWFVGALYILRYLVFACDRNCKYFFFGLSLFLEWSFKKQFGLHHFSAWHQTLMVFG